MQEERSRMCLLSTAKFGNELSDKLKMLVLNFLVLSDLGSKTLYLWALLCVMDVLALRLLCCLYPLYLIAKYITPFRYCLIVECLWALKCFSALCLHWHWWVMGRGVMPFGKWNVCVIVTFPLNQPSRGHAAHLSYTEPGTWCVLQRCIAGTVLPWACQYMRYENSGSEGKGICAVWHLGLQKLPLLYGDCCFPICALGRFLHMPG